MFIRRVAGIRPDVLSISKIHGYELVLAFASPSEINLEDADV
jgi:hypothetical protein